MKYFKYVIIVQFLIAIYVMILFITTPIEKKVTIPLNLFYFLMSLSWLGLIFITMFMAKDWYRIKVESRNKNEVEKVQK